MPANRCPNPDCEYFNRALPNNAKVCPWCSTPLGNVIPNTPENPQNPAPQQPAPQAQQQQPPPQPYQQQPPPQPYQQQPPPQPYQQQPPPQYQQPPYVPPIPQQPPAPRLPVLKLTHSSGREFTLCAENGSIGRRSESMPIPPEIDLNGIPEEGIVSRRHARIYWDWSQNTYMIVDTSKNGTYLNGNLLNTNFSYRLLNGNELQLGQDKLIVFKISIA
ncbi:MAG: FHA domain-containing protein [Cyanobacteria bacterium P01_A01_bin.68]